MNIEKSFTYPFEDKQWISKLGLGAVIGLFNAIVGWIPCIGWMISLVLLFS